MKTRAAPYPSFLAVVATGVFGWAAVGLLAVWGLSYLYQCAIVLTQPGVPLALEYTTENGTRVFRADSFHVDPWKRSVQVLRPVIAHDDGTPVVRSQHLNLLYGGPSLHVTTSGLAVFLKRDTAGRFDIQDFLPKKQPGKFGPTLTFRSDSVRLAYLDLTGKPLRQEALVKNLRLWSARGNLTAHGEILVAGLRPVPVHLQNDPTGLTWIRFARLDGDAAKFLPLVARFLPTRVASALSELQVAELTVEGELELATNGKSVGLGGDVRLRSESVRVGRRGVEGRFDGRVSGSIERASVSFLLDDGANRASFEGLAAFTGTSVYAGNFGLRTGSSPWAFLRTLVPKDLRFTSADISGWLSYGDGRTTSLGTARLASLSVQKERITKLQGMYAFDGQNLRVNVDRAQWRGGPANGAFLADLRSKSLSGLAHAPNREIGTLLESFGVKGVTGTGSLSAVVTGPMGNPRVEAYADGKAVVKGSDGKATQAGPFEARANVSGPVALVNRLIVSGPNGILVASGKADLASKALQARFVAGAIPASLLNPDADGTLFATGKITGTIDRPTYSSRVEGYGLKYKDQGVPLLVSEFRGDKTKVEITRLSASSGTGLLEAIAGIDLKTKEITGRFNAENLILSQWLGSDVLGSADLQDGILSGTYERPQVTGKLTGKKIFAYGSSIDAVTLFLAASLDEIRATDAIVQIEDGTIRGSGSFDLTKEAGALQARAENVPLDRLLRLGPEVAFDGRASGQFGATVGSGTWNGSGEVSLANVSVNETPLGAGSLALTLNRGTLEATGEIGSVDRYLGLDSLAYDPAAGKVDAQISAYNLRVKDLVSAAKPVWSPSAGQAKELVETIDGAFTGRATLTADKADWAIGNSELSFENLVVGGKSAGSLTGKVTRTGSTWMASDILWKAGSSTLSANATYREAGTVDVSANLDEFDLNWLNVFVPEAPVIHGRASVSVVASGPKDDPTGRATVYVKDASFVSPTTQVASDPLQVIIDDFTFGNKHAEFSGQANYLGFTGDISASVPYTSLQSGSRSRRREPLNARIDIKPRPLSDFAEQLPNVDMERSDGTVQLSANIAGLIEDLRINAGASFVSSKLSLKDIDTELHDLTVRYDQSDRKARFTAAGKSSRGGSFETGLDANLADVFGSNFNLDELLEESTVTGSAKFDQFAWSEKLMGAQFPTLAKIDGAIQVQGPLRTPVVTGDAVVENLVLNLPSELAAATGGTLLIDPVLDNIRLQVAPGSRIETGIGALAVSGIGRLDGSLSDPDVNIPLRLDSGTFRLPSGRLVLEPGGSLVFNYSSLGGGDPVARVNLDIEGRTSVVSQRNSGQYETYQVTINIRGNVLDERSLVMTATSDPADLSQEEILALIGQRDLIQGLAQGVLGGSGDRGVFRDAFYALAVPNFSQNLTQGIAQGLNLDYVSVDYNPFDQFVLSAGKTVGKGLVLQATRQLQESGFGPLKWEVKLVYRLPMADRFFSRVRLAFGIDQSVPWKFSVNWSRRF